MHISPVANPGDLSEWLMPDQPSTRRPPSRQVKGSGSMAVKLRSVPIEPVTTVEPVEATIAQLNRPIEQLAHLQPQVKQQRNHWLTIVKLLPHTACLRLKEPLPANRHPQIKVQRTRSLPQIQVGEIDLLGKYLPLASQAKQAIYPQWAVENPLGSSIWSWESL